MYYHDVKNRIEFRYVLKYHEKRQARSEFFPAAVLHLKGYQWQSYGVSYPNLKTDGNNYTTFRYNET